MPVGLKVTGAEQYADQHKAFERDLRGRIRAKFAFLDDVLVQRTLATFGQAGLHVRTGTLLAGINPFSGVSQVRAWFGEVTDVGDGFYGAWQEFGLALRPAGERAMSRHGIINRYLGRARDASHKPWGLPARPWMRPAMDQVAPMGEAAAEQALQEAVEAFNAAG